MWLMCLGLTSYAIGRLSQQLYLKSTVHHLMGAVGLVLAFLVSLDLVEGSLHGLDIIGAVGRLVDSLAVLLPVPDELVIFLAVVILWQRGSTLSGSPELAWGREGLHFRLGVLLYAFYIAARRDIEGAPIPELLPTFFLASTMAMAVARANSLGHQPGGSRAPISMKWTAGLTGLLVAATTLGVGAGLALNSHAAHQLALLFGLALSAVLGLSFRLLLPILMVFNPLIQLLIDWLRKLFDGLGTVMAQVQLNPVLPPESPGSENAAIPGWVQALTAAWPYIQWGLVLLGAIGVIYLVTRGRRGSRRDDRPDMTMDEDLDREAGRRARLGRLEEAQRRLGDWVRATSARSWLAPLVIRRIYLAMLTKAAGDGRPRREDETPAEFQGVLGDLYPGEVASSRQITSAFELVRYGLRPEDPQVVERVREAWAKLKQVEA